MYDVVLLFHIRLFCRALIDCHVVLPAQVVYALGALCVR